MRSLLVKHAIRFCDFLFSIKAIQYFLSMKKKLFLGLALMLSALAAPINSWACTDFIVGKKASTDGSVIISYAADSHTLYGELFYWPAAKWAKGAMRQIIEWDSNKPLGFIPQPGQTYQVVGNMNEYQVAITESTWGGRPELEAANGIMDYGSLIYVALQRSKTAREAIKIMTDLVRDYGYASSGESFTIADKNEVWVMELIGKGPKKKGAVWVAIRIPDNAISGHANQARIQQIPFGDKENCMYEPDVVKLAREKGWFKGEDKDFSFQAAYNPYDAGGLRGCEARVWSFFRKYSKDMDKYIPFLQNKGGEPMPLYIIPDRKVSVADVRNAMRDHYENTPFCMTNDPGAGPYKVPYRWRPMSYKVDGAEYVNERAVATQQTGFVLVAQLRSWLPDEVGGVLWFGVDDADMTVFTPTYGCINRVPECYRVGNGDLMHFSWTSAFWIHNWVANMAYARYEPMIADIRPVQTSLEKMYDQQQAMVDREAMRLLKEDPAKARAFLTDYTVNTADNSVARWKRLGEYLLVKYMDGNLKKEENGQFKTNGYGFSAMPNFPGYDQAFYENIVRATGDRLRVK